MSTSLRAYRMVEAVFGRSRVGRLGRWLYLGSRRELKNDPALNGEYLLQRAWVRHQADRPSEILNVFDVGANVGDWTANMVEQFRQAGLSSYSLRAFEPAPVQRNLLAQRCNASITAGRVVLDSRALAAASGEAHFGLTGDSTGTSSLITEATSSSTPLRVTLTTLDAVAQEYNIDKIQYIKIDTEGNDFNVIVGGSQLIFEQRIDIIQFEYNARWIDFGHWLREVFSMLSGSSYELGRLTPDGVEIYEQWHPELDRYIETNYVILHARMLGAIPHWIAHFDASNMAVRAPAPDRQ